MPARPCWPLLRSIPHGLRQDACEKTADFEWMDFGEAATAGAGGTSRLVSTARSNGTPV